MVDTYVEEIMLCCAALDCCRYGEYNAEISVDNERHRVATRRQEEAKASKNVQEIQVRILMTVLHCIAFLYLHPR